MSSAGVEVNDKALRAAVDRLTARAGAMGRILPAIGNILVANAQLTFRESRDPWGVAWAPLTATTLYQRAARRTGGKPYKRDGTLKKSAAAIFATAKPLLDTGRLRNSVTFRIDGSTVIVGTNVIYAGTQQFGAKKRSYKGRAPWGDVPARRFLPIRTRGGNVDLPLDTRRQIVDVLTRHLLAR